VAVALLLYALLAAGEATTLQECRAAYRELRLPAAHRVDAVRVVLRGEQPGAASRVTVQAGDAERALTVSEGGTWGLEVAPALETVSVIVGVEPAGPRGACVDAVVLLDGGDEVAVVGF
jgi:hypothetical protein